MTGRDDHSESQRPMPAIPDGGLSQTMPDWLRRPPAWRSEPASPVESPDRNDRSVPASIDLPPVDDSVIDPRELILAADLPAWLRSLGVPQAQAPDRPDAETTSDRSVGEVLAAVTQRRNTIVPAAMSSRRDDTARPAFRPRKLAAPEVAAIPPLTAPGSVPRTPMPRLTIALAVALGIAILVILALLVF